MPKRARHAEIGGYWLSRRPNSPAWCRTWFDPDTRQTRRSSLGERDLRQAELKLAAWVTQNAEIRDQPPAGMPLATVLTRYWHAHAKLLASAEAARIELRYWSAFFGADMVADLTPARQEEFVAELRAKGHSTGYISRILSTGRAAINRAHRRGELLAVPFVADVETAEDRRGKDPKGRRITIQEMARLFDAADQHHVVMFLMIACCTLARPDAVLDLTVYQRDREAEVLHLNPAGRRQTRKYRPTVPEAATLTPWLDLTEKDQAEARSSSKGLPPTRSGVVAATYVAWRGRPIASIKTAWRKLRSDAGLDVRVTPYSIRHTMARELRRRRVPRDQISQFLGHLPTGTARTTAIYAPDEPDYLAEAVAAIDAIMQDVDRVAARSLIPSLRASCVREASEEVVGAAGIEPATPTMSTYRDNRSRSYLRVLK